MFHVYVKSAPVHNEDTHFHVVLDEYILFGVADGHAGNGSAALCQREIGEVMQDCMQHTDDMQSAVASAFRELHARCVRLSSHLSESSGTTLTVILINPTSGVYICANVGDSHAIHVTPTSYRHISTSHRLQDNPSERMRLREHVSYLRGDDNLPAGPPRLFPGGLASSRTIGDADCTFATCEPSMFTDTLDDADAIVVCSDGVWDFATTKKLVKVVRESFNPEFVCRLAAKGNTHDDATCLVGTRQRMKMSIHTSLFALFSRSGSNSSLSSDETDDNATVFKVKI